MMNVFGRGHRPALSVLCCAASLAAFAPAASAQNLRIDSQLRRLARTADRAGQRAHLRALVSRGDTVAVTIRLDSTSDVRADLRRLGARAVNRRGSTLEAYVPVDALEALGEVPGIEKIDPIVRPRYLVTSQGVTAHNAATWHVAQRRGQGVKVGIIDSFDNYSALVGSELPYPAGLRCYVDVGTYTTSLADCAGGSVHGTGVAETLVDISPDVQLYIADPQSLMDFRATVEWMVAQGVRVINHSAAWNWQGPGDGTSPHPGSALATAEWAAARSTLFVTAAGNEQRATWTGAHADSDGDSWLDFSSNVETNGVTLRAGEVLMAQARWADSWAAASRDYDLYLFNQNGEIVSGSDNGQFGSPGDTPFEFLAFTAPAAGTYYLGLRHFDGPMATWLQVQAFTGHWLQYSTPGYSIANPAESAHPAVLAIGATQIGSPTSIALYSSQGPTRDGRVKPDLVGVAGADTVSYGPGGFHGTSQATPHVAGLAALILAATPSLSAIEVAAELKKNTQPRGAAPNNTWGHGFAYLVSPACGFALRSGTRRLFAAGGSGSVVVDANNSSCAWTAASNAPWLTVTSATAGTGSVTLTFAAAANPSNARRTGHLSIAGFTHVVDQAGVAAVPSDDDLSGDGRADILLQHDDGRVAAWFMDETYLVDGSSLNPPRVDPAWRIAGTGDADGDGRQDIYWQHTSGSVAIWRMNGVALVEGMALEATLPAGWRIHAVADLSGDGKPDLVLQHVDGRLAAWILDGRRIVEGRFLSPTRVHPAWQIVGAGDADRDGSIDLFFQNQTDGLLAVWLMNGTTLVDGKYLTPASVADQGWRVRGVGDLNGDGRPDLLWQHTGSGTLAAWMLDGATLLDGAVFDPPSLSDPRWRVAGPR